MRRSVLVILSTKDGCEPLVHPGALEAQTRTRWLIVSVLIGCGVVAAAHIGKVAPAIPTLKDELGIGDVTAGLMLASISVAAALFAYPLGRYLRRFEPSTVLVIALLWLALLSLTGAAFTQALPILVTRAAESMGYLVVVLIVPALLRSTAAVPDRRYVMALWGTFMPIGTGLALLVAPALLATWGWQSLWIASAVACVVIAVAVQALRASLRASPEAVSDEDADLSGLRGDLIRLAAIFGLYAATWLAVLGLLPTALYEAGASIRFASMMTGLAVALNAPGNFVAAHLARKGVPPRRVVMIGATGIAISSWAIYADHGWTALVVVGAVVFSFISGFIPASLFGELNRVGDPRLVPTATGALVQGSGVGQLLGPPALASVLLAAGAGSVAGPAVITVTALVIILLALRLRAS